MTKRFMISIFIILLGISQSVYAQSVLSLPELKKEARKSIESYSQILIEVSDAIWECAEIALLEYESARILMEAAEKNGFKIDKEVAGLPTAFVASYGSGRPVIGILAEYDALPGLSQEGLAFPKPVEKGGAGHGCGHNLFGAGSLGAALAIKDVMEKYDLKGTIKLYGCPAEEDVGGKMYMAREGLFDDLDACLAWHPDYSTRVDVSGSQAIDDLEVEFFGKTSHAAFDPWMGLSALDALEMMTFGVNLLREHVKPSVRMHYVIRSGGDVPNVVPDYAKLWLWVRDSTRTGVKDVVARVGKIAEGAAVATGTTSKVTNLGSYHEMLVNMTGAVVMQKNLESIGPISYTDEEIDYAKRIQREIGVAEKGIVSEVKELETPRKDPVGGSTDVAEVSWITPTLHVSVTTAPFEIPWHSWGVVSSSRHSIGHKGMLLAGKILASTGLDLLMDEKLLQRMRKEFIEKLDGYTYRSGIPPDRKPPVRIK